MRWLLALLWAAPLSGQEIAADNPLLRLQKTFAQIAAAPLINVSASDVEKVDPG